jgi:quinoprotein glucose dehydrogenase
MEKRASKELAKLLAHADMRVRQEAQFELAARGEVATLQGVAAANPAPLARLHAIWGIGQIARKTAQEPSALIALFEDADPGGASSGGKNVR